jgi:hypothetical protein
MAYYFPSDGPRTYVMCPGDQVSFNARARLDRTPVGPVERISRPALTPGAK